MKSAYEIPWNLLDHYVVNAPYYFMGLPEILKNTGLDEAKVEKMRSKFDLLKKIQDTKDGVYWACELLSEIEQGKHLNNFMSALLREVKNDQHFIP